QAEDGIRDFHVTGVQTCALPIFSQSQQSAPAPARERVAFGRDDVGQRQIAFEDGMDDAKIDLDLEIQCIGPRPDDLVAAWNGGRSEERRVGRGWRPRATRYE